MRYQTALRWLLPAIFCLALLAALMGLLYETPGAPFAFTSVRGEQVTIRGHGLYFYDTVSSAAQMQANDFVTLVLGLPLLALSGWLASRGSLRGKLLLAGTLGFFLYTYMSMSMNTAYNALFLVYVALFGLSLYALVLSLLSIDLVTLPRQFSERLPRRLISTLLLVTGGFLLLAWVGGRILPTLISGSTPLLENGITMVIQAMDLVLIAPLAILGGILLLRRSAWGFLLASVASMKMITMGIAVSAMGINMARNGAPDSVVLVGVFIVLTLVNLLMAGLLLRNIRAVV